jgi:uncharacterized protein YceK
MDRRGGGVRLVALVACGAVCGCGTMQNLQGKEPTPFGGVSREVRYIRQGDGLVEDIVGRPLAVLDLSLTLVGDTLTLPVVLLSSIPRSTKEEQTRVVGTPLTEN